MRVDPESGASYIESSEGTFIQPSQVIQLADGSTVMQNQIREGQVSAIECLQVVSVFKTNKHV